MSEILLVNPRRRRRKKRAKKKTSTRRRRRRNPARKRTYRRRRNPRRITARTIQSDVTEALQGATGGLALDVTLGFLPLPANLKAGLVGTGVKALIAIGMGAVLSNTRMVRPATAKAWANGALTVVLHGELKKLTQQFFPNVPMGEYMSYNDMNSLGYYGSGLNPGPVYLPDLSSEGMDIDESGFGEYIGGPGNYMDDFHVG